MNSEPLKAGDLCEVVNGLGRQASPNLGQHVTIHHRVFGAHGGDHSVYGPVYRCEGPDLCQLADAEGYVKLGWADIPGTWLRRIEPPKQGTEAKTDKEITA